MMQGWTIFAKQIIAELAAYDRENKTEYAYFLTQHNGKPDGNAIDVLAGVMRRVDQKNQWEPVKQEVQD